MSSPNLPTPSDFSKMNEIGKQIKELNDQCRNKKEILKNFKDKIIKAMLKMNIRQIDKSGNGSGPFLTLVPVTNKPTLSGIKLEKYCGWLSNEMQKGVKFTKKQLVSSIEEFLKQYKVYTIEIKEYEYEHRKDVGDLLKHVAKNKNAI